MKELFLIKILFILSLFSYSQNDTINKKWSKEIYFIAYSTKPVNYRELKGIKYINDNYSFGYSLGTNLKYKISSKLNLNTGICFQKRVVNHDSVSIRTTWSSDYGRNIWKYLYIGAPLNIEYFFFKRNNIQISGSFGFSFHLLFYDKLYTKNYNTNYKEFGGGDFELDFNFKDKNDTYNCLYLDLKVFYTLKNKDKLGLVINPLFSLDALVLYPYKKFHNYNSYGLGISYEFY